MGREIKFRAWDAERKIMCDFSNPKDGIEYCGGELHVSDGWDSFDNPTYGDCRDKWEIMQYTGIKDSQGVEIYEGDVVLVLYTDWPSKSPDDPMGLEDYMDSLSHIGVVDKRRFSYVAIQKDNWNEDIEMSLDVGAHGRIKVIGNIHENPELVI